MSMRRPTLGAAAIAAVLVVGACGSTPDVPDILGEVVPSERITALDRGATPPRVPLTSSTFGVPIRFVLDPFGNNPANQLAPGSSDFCDARVSARAIVLPWLMGCVSDLRILLPEAVDCGIVDPPADAESVARRLVTHPNLGARDLGSLDDTTSLPEGFVTGAARGRVVDIPGNARPFDGDAVNPDGCVLRGDPDIELRADMPQRLVLLDVGEQLVVLRVSGGGYDGASGSAARARGYGADDIDDLFDVIVRRVHGLTFGAAVGSGG